MKLSYIIPTYNSINFLEETVKSVINQKIDIPFEIVISDDCSTDGTQDLIRKLAKNHKEIVYRLSYTNYYTPENRNLAMRISSGDLIYMLDHDNVLQYGSIQKLIDKIRDGYDCASVKQLHYFKGDYDKERTPLDTDRLVSYDYNEFTLEKCLNENTSPAASNNYMYKREFFDKIGGYRDGVLENLSFALRLLDAGAKFVVVSDTKYFHRINPNGMWYKANKNFIKKFIYNRNKKKLIKKYK